MADLKTRVAQAIWKAVTHSVEPWPWTDPSRNPAEARAQIHKYTRMAAAAIDEVRKQETPHDCLRR